MKKAMLGAVLVATAAASPAAAQTRPGLEIGLEVSRTGYKEFDGDDLFIRQRGHMVGLHLGFVQPIASGLFVRAWLSGAAGAFDYDPLDEPVLEDIEQSSGRFELHVGHDFRLPGGATVTPFAGIGVRLQEDHGSGRQTNSGLLSFDRETRYTYIPAGVAATVPVGTRSRVIVSAQYNHLIGGSVTSRFSEVEPDAPDITLDLNGGQGLEASAMLSLPVGRRSAANFGPFVRRWTIRESDSLTLTNPDDPTEEISFTEPRSRSTEVGLRVSFSF